MSPRGPLLGVAGWAFGVYLLSGSTPSVSASSSNAVPARTGGFGEMTCQQCHWENPLNEPSGRLTLEGIPERYTPGEQYLITVTLARPGLGRAGFQLSAREDGMNMSSGMNAGALASTDKTTQIVRDEKLVSYIEHTEQGTDAKGATASWKVAWTAPDMGNVVFHAAANASNDDDSPLGDYIYTAVSRSRQADR